MVAVVGFGWVWSRGQKREARSRVSRGRWKVRCVWELDIKSVGEASFSMLELGPLVFFFGYGLELELKW